MAEGDAQADKMMILPYYGYRYEYVGDDLNLTESEGAVYRRIKGDGQSGRILAGLVSGLNFPDVNLSSFANLRATNLSLMEDKNLGLMITLDFNEDAVFISENWEKWRIMERENCGGDQACWDKWRIKIEDVPADNSLVAKANSFLSRHRINLDNYGDPIVDNNWREMYVQSPDKNNFYIPEYASVVYPLMINEKPVRDQSGSFSGLRVTINLLHDAVSGLSGLSPFRYESSLYKLEDNAKNILAAAEKGGWNRGWFNGSENIRTLQLGTPEKSLVQIWHYKNGRHNELMVPALVFPVLNQPEDGTYYGSKFVTVPLVAEMLQEMNDEQNNLPLPVDLPSTVMPMIKNEVLPVSDETEKFSSEIQPETMPMLPTEAR